MSFTAAPWTYEIHAQCDPTGEYFHLIEITGEEGASTILMMDGDCDDAKDNARLIAAAPELLGCLIRLCDWCKLLDFDGSEYIKNAVENAEVVITKALPEGDNRKLTVVDNTSIEHGGYKHYDKIPRVHIYTRRNTPPWEANP